MPTYQYACTACAHQFDAVQSFADDPLTECPVCAGRLRKLFGSVGVVFKGSGFYRNDSRAAANGKGAGGKSAEEKGSADGKPDGKSDGKTDVKADTKSDGKPADSSKPADSKAKSPAATGNP